MKRVYIAVAVLLLSAMLSLFSLHTITKESRTLVQTAREIKTLCAEENFRQLQLESKSLKKQWKKDSLPFSLLTTHYHYDALEESVDKVYHACQRKDKKEIIKACESLMFEAEHIITSIRPSGENVF